MSTNFALRLQQQKYGSTFDYLNQQLGPVLVSLIHTEDLSERKGCDSAHPEPWTKPEELPADIVKAILPNGRPLLAVRYYHRVKDKESYILEILFQRYRLPDEKEDVSEIEYSNRISNWYVKNFSGDSIYKAHNISATFQIIRDLADGESLDKTDERYLPMYKDRFAIKV